MLVAVEHVSSTACEGSDIGAYTLCYTLKRWYTLGDFNSVTGNRPKGRPKQRWMDTLHTDLETGVLIAKSVKDTPREEYMNSEMDPSKYDPTVEFVQYIMDKADAASPRVKAIFQDAFENDKTDNEELLNALEQSDREELQELQNQFQAKEAELGLK
ncbi:hypothetical protein ANCCEY_00243 [Ancylostoma ceylanicum]|uniref:Uncharacterized protein n=1 Tax=Ancylostoma ceylanicum TaxID=53326 RepID=A0A0D6M967_9BILA|nr:hypothetical protein ANCCEY_00243 [Ancylostoma ceylanicum]